MSYRRARSELSYPFIRSVFIVLLLVLIYALQQMLVTAPAKTKLSIPERLVSSSDALEDQSTLTQVDQADESEDSKRLFFSNFLLTLRR